MQIMVLKYYKERKKEKRWKERKKRKGREGKGERNVGRKTGKGREEMRQCGKSFSHLGGRAVS